MEGTGVMPVMDIAGNRNDFMNCAMWNNPFMYLIFMGMFNGYGWNNRGGDYVSQANLAQGLDNQDKNGQLRGIANGLADVGYALTNNIKDTGTNVSGAISALASQVQMGFCNTNHNIDNIKYENAKNTSDIITATNNGVQRIMDGICGLKMDAKDARIAELTGHLADAKLAISQQAQNAYLIEKLTPTT